MLKAPSNLGDTTLTISMLTKCDCLLRASFFGPFPVTRHTNKPTGSRPVPFQATSPVQKSGVFMLDPPY